MYILYTHTHTIVSYTHTYISLSLYIYIYTYIYMYIYISLSLYIYIYIYSSVSMCQIHRFVFLTCYLCSFEIYHLPPVDLKSSSCWCLVLVRFLYYSIT